MSDAEMIKIKCCKDCSDRKLGCHEKCEKYNKEKHELQEKNDQIHKAKTKEIELDEVCFKHYWESR